MCMIIKKVGCQYITKKYCIWCKEITQQKSYVEYEKMPPEYIAKNMFFLIKLFSNYIILILL